LRGLVYALTPRQSDSGHSFWKRPFTLGVIVLITAASIKTSIAMPILAG